MLDHVHSLTFDRYVDTYNKGGGIPASPFQSPSIPSVKANTPANGKFFIPTPIAPIEQITEGMTESKQGSPVDNDTPTTSTSNDSVIIHSSPHVIHSPPRTLQRVPSVDNASGLANETSSAPQSRRTASWGGTCFDQPDEMKPLGEEALGVSESGFLPSKLTFLRIPVNNSNIGDGLHEVEL